MNLVNVVLIDNHLHHCTIVNRDFVIRLRNENEGVWPRPTQLWELHCAFVIRLNVVNEGGAESDRLGWHSWFANENEGRRDEVSLNDSLNDSPLPETRLNERTNERTNDSFWRTERRELIRGNESWNPSLASTEVQQLNTTRVQIGGGRSSQSHPSRSHCRCQHERWSPPAERVNPHREHLPAPPPRSPKMVDTLSCCLDHRHKQQSGSIPPPKGGGRLPSCLPRWTPTYRHQAGGQ